MSSVLLDSISRSFGELVAVIAINWLLSRFFEWIVLKRIVGNFAVMVWLSSMLPFALIFFIWITTSIQPNPIGSSMLIMLFVVATVVAPLRIRKHNQQLAKAAATTLA